MRERGRSLSIVPRYCHELRDFGSVLDRRVASLSTLAIRQLAGGRAGVGTAQAAVQRAGLAVFSGIAGSVSAVVLVDGDRGFHNGSHSGRRVGSLRRKLDRLGLDLQGKRCGIEQLFVRVTHRHIQRVDSGRKGPVVVVIIGESTRNIQTICIHWSERASINLGLLVVTFDDEPD